ncbi:hypothetical protein C8R44DRAFT_754068 [Mycena epipterygia]|nr:hypothetical protein C8R44DRAFT_754068 [Mycena epipterygia]
MRASIIVSSTTVFSGLLSLHGALAVPVGTPVITPLGFRANTTIHQVPSGGRVAHVGPHIQVVGPNGDVLGLATPKQAMPRPSPNEQTGWITYASWLNDNDSPISSFTTTWTVPDLPATDNGQTLFLFNSIEPATFDAIVQPVLQYGPSAAGGGSCEWTVASWYLFQDHTFVTTPVPVTVGQTLTGTISLVSQDGTTFSYIAEFAGIDGTALPVDGAEELA